MEPRNKYLWAFFNSDTFSTRTHRAHKILPLASIDFAVSSNRRKQNRLRPFVLDELKDDSQVVAGARCPGAFQLTLQLVGLETRMKGVRGKEA